jgi:hypothetical protein
MYGTCAFHYHAKEEPLDGKDQCSSNNYFDATNIPRHGDTMEQLFGGAATLG